MSKTCKKCEKYRPVRRLYGSFDATGKPVLKKTLECENHGCCGCCRKED